MKCEKCGCDLVAVDSIVHEKWYECIRHLNSPELCVGTDLHCSLAFPFSRSESRTGFMVSQG